MTFSAASLWSLARQGSYRWVLTRSCSTGLWIMQWSIWTAEWFSTSTTEWKLERRFKESSDWGSGGVPNDSDRFFCVWKFVKNCGIILMLIKDIKSKFVKRLAE